MQIAIVSRVKSTTPFPTPQNLERINLGHNKFSGSVPVLRDLIHLTEIILRDNEFDSVQTESFAGDSSLTILDLSHQRSQGLTLLDYAFALASSHIKLILTGNNVPVISSYAFDGLNNVNHQFQCLHLLLQFAFHAPGQFHYLALNYYMDYVRH